MGYSRHTIPLIMKPSNKIITENTINMFLMHVREGFTITAAGKAISIRGHEFKQLLEIVPKTQLEDALRIGAETLIDEASTLLKNAENKDDIEKAKALAQHYRWLASKLNKDRYGESTVKQTDTSPTYNFMISIGGNAPEIKTVSAKTIEQDQFPDVNQFLP